MFYKIKKSDFVTTNKFGREIISSQKLKEAIVNSKTVVSDGAYLYLVRDKNFIECLFFNANLQIRKKLLEENAQSYISKSLMDTIIDDLIVDLRLFFDKANLNPSNLINLQNGIFNLSNFQLLKREKCPHIYFNYIIDINYRQIDDTTPYPTLKNFLATAFKEDPSMGIFLAENIGFLLSSVNTFRKAVIF